MQKACLRLFNLPRIFLLIELTWVSSTNIDNRWGGHNRWTRTTKWTMLSMLHLSWLTYSRHILRGVLVFQAFWGPMVMTLARYDLLQSLSWWVIFLSYYRASFAHLSHFWSHHAERGRIRVLLLHAFWSRALILVRCVFQILFRNCFHRKLNRSTRSALLRFSLRVFGIETIISKGLASCLGSLSMKSRLSYVPPWLLPG